MNRVETAQTEEEGVLYAETVFRRQNEPKKVRFFDMPSVSMSDLSFLVVVDVKVNIEDAE